MVKKKVKPVYLEAEGSDISKFKAMHESKDLASRLVFPEGFTNPIQNDGLAISRSAKRATLKYCFEVTEMFHAQVLLPDDNSYQKGSLIVQKNQVLGYIKNFGAHSFLSFVTVQGSEGFDLIQNGLYQVDYKLSTFYRLDVSDVPSIRWKVYAVEDFVLNPGRLLLRYPAMSEINSENAHLVRTDLYTLARQEKERLEHLLSNSEKRNLGISRKI